MKKCVLIISLMCALLFSFSVCLANNWKDIESNDLTIVHGKNIQDSRFTEEIIDINYNFTKIKTMKVSMGSSQEVICSPNILILLKDMSEKCIKDFMGRKVVDKERSDAILEILITKWDSAFSHRVPERIVYEAYESYEGYKVESPSFYEISDWERRKRKAKEEGRPAPPRPRPRTVWTISGSWFQGSRRVITSDSRGGRARYISSNTPFSGSKKVNYPAHDLFSATVIATFNLRDSKTNALIMSRKGTLTEYSRIKDGQLAVYKTICDSFCNDYKVILKQVKKEVKKSKKDKQNLST